MPRNAVTRPKQSKALKTQSQLANGWARRRDNRDTRQEILDAAAVAFARNGFHGVSLADIATEVGIKAPSVYNHFGSKEGILFAYLTDFSHRMLARCEAAIAAQTSPAERLCAFVKAHVLLEIEHLDTMPLVNMYFQQGTGFTDSLSNEQRAELKRSHKRLVALLRGILTDGKRRGEMHFNDAATATFSILGIVSNVVYWFRRNGPLDARQVADEIVALTASTVGLRRTRFEEAR